jgi:hypothetical protein
MNLLEQFLKLQFIKTIFRFKSFEMLLQMAT